jgi:hypothetical protein
MSLRCDCEADRLRHAGSVRLAGRPSFVTLRPALLGLTEPEARLAWTHREATG